MMGMPIMVVNSDIVSAEISNDPGQIIPVAGGGEDTGDAISYVSPPDFSPAFDQNISSLISNTLKQSGANDIVLGDVKPENTSAILAVRETATLPLLSVQNRITASRRVGLTSSGTQYGRRKVKIRRVRPGTRCLTGAVPQSGNQRRLTSGVHFMERGAGGEHSTACTTGGL